MKELTFLGSELERAKTKKQALENLFETRKISQMVYDRIAREVEEEITKIEKRTELQTHKISETIGELRNIIGLLEHHLTRIQIRFSVGEMDEKQFKREKDAYARGITSLRTQIGSLERALEGFSRREVGPEKAFHFYAAIGKPTGQMALSLEDFAKKVRIISVASLEFHQVRGDFANWIRDIFNELSLAEKIEKIEEKGESLRRRIIETLERPEQHHVVTCPSCGKELKAQKMWKMAGRPDKEGRRLQLTIGHYRCPECERSFRQVLAKEVI